LDEQMGLKWQLRRTLFIGIIKIFLAAAQIFFLILWLAKGPILSIILEVPMETICSPFESPPPCSISAPDHLSCDQFTFCEGSNKILLLWNGFIFLLIIVLTLIEKYLLGKKKR